MNEQSIETKYRPQDFKEVIGQDAVVKSLENAIAKKLGTAFLFIGPSGVGKTTLARIAALELGCRPEDLQEIDAATKTGIDDMRAVMDDLMYRPLGEGTIKAVIVDEFHMLSKNAVTALLKTLEDPPSWVRWFLCTTEATKVPVAIKTRCLTYQLKEVRTDDLIDLLDSTDEAKELHKDIIRLCAKEAGGSPRQALSNLGVCLVAETAAEAAELLRSAGDAPAAFDLARALMNGANWDEVRGILANLKETSPESVRHVLRAYMTKVVLEPKNAKGAENAFAILEAFAEPFNSADGISPLVLACGRLVFAQ
jgi:DNA polymerase III subunit gamma/tau